MIPYTKICISPGPFSHLKPGPDSATPLLQVNLKSIEIMKISYNLAEL